MTYAATTYNVQSDGQSNDWERIARKIMRMHKCSYYLFRLVAEGKCGYT